MADEDDYFDELLNDDDEDNEPAITDGDQVTCRTPMIAERESDGRQGAARGAFYWDADDPMVVALHFQIMANSIQVNAQSFPVPDEYPGGEPHVTCGQCGDDINWGGIGAVIRQPEDPKTGILWCLMCAEDHPSTQFAEGLWVLSRAALEAVLLGERPEETPISVATCRAIEDDPDNFQVVLRQPKITMIMTMPIERLSLMFEGVQAWEYERGDQEENYLEQGLAELSKLANHEK